MAELTNCDRLAIIGRALFSENRWKRPLARALGVDKRQVQRWAMGESEPSDQVICRALDVVRRYEKRLEYAKAVARMPPWITRMRSPMRG
jgi:transcriptional regulator with XRE-family HTH domain